jgi:hypothetical protein
MSGQPDAEAMFAMIGKAAMGFAVIIAILDRCTTADLLMRAQLEVASHAAEYPELVAVLTAEIDRRLASMGAPTDPGSGTSRRW